MRDDFYFLYCQSHSTPRSIIWLNNLVNLNSNSVSWGSTPHSGRTGRVISTQLWLLHWSSRVLQSEPNHSPHYRLQGQISVGGPLNQALYLPTEINWKFICGTLMLPINTRLIHICAKHLAFIKHEHIQVWKHVKAQAVFYSLDLNRPNCKLQITVSDVLFFVFYDIHLVKSTNYRKSVYFGVFQKQEKQMR